MIHIPSQKKREKKKKKKKERKKYPSRSNKTVSGRYKFHGGILSRKSNFPFSEHLPFSTRVGEMFGARNVSITNCGLPASTKELGASRAQQLANMAYKRPKFGSHGLPNGGTGTRENERERGREGGRECKGERERKRMKGRERGRE